MTEIKGYRAKAQSEDSTSPKGSYDNPYTEDEFNSMSAAGTWTGGWVDGMGYVGLTVEVTPSSDSFSDSDSWSDPWGSMSDPWGSSDDKSNSPSGNGGNGGGGGSHSGNSNDDGYSVSNAVSHLVANAYPSYNEKCGNCARAVRKALEAGGLSTVGRPTSACDYDTFLPNKGFYEVDKNNYTPRKGDIIVLEAVENHPHGHIAMYSGSNWVSDYVQRDMWGGSAFRNKAEYSIFRK